MTAMVVAYLLALKAAAQPQFYFEYTGFAIPIAGKAAGINTAAGGGVDDSIIRDS
jgi:hypothetical protein